MNSCHFNGRTTRDIVLARSMAGISYVRFTIAVNERVYNKDINDWDTSAVFVDCVAFGDVAHRLDGIKKGTKIDIVCTYMKTKTVKENGECIYWDSFKVKDFDLGPEPSGERWHTTNWY